MDEPASDRLNPNLVVTVVVLLIAVVALVVAGVVLTRDTGDSVSTGGTTPGTAGPGTSAAPGPAPGTTPGTTPGTSTCNESAPVPRPQPDSAEPPTAALQEALVGCSEADVTTRARAAGWTIRVVQRDGESFAVTMDYQPSRLNLTIDGGVVTDVEPG